MSRTQICARYANSLYLQAREQGSVEDIHAFLAGFDDFLQKTPEFRVFLRHPLLPQEERVRVLTAVFSGKVPPLFEKFLFFINCKNRLNLLEGMVTAFDALYLTAHNQVRAQVQVALPLEIPVREELVARLSQKYGKEILARWQIRKEILGGFRILIEGRLHDYSFTNQLEKFRGQVLRAL